VNCRHVFVVMQAELLDPVSHLVRSTFAPSWSDTPSSCGWVREWTIRLLIPRHLARVAGICRAVFREQLARPLRRANLDELRWYFHVRRSGRHCSGERFDQAARVFRAPRFRVLYRAWLERGEPVLDATLSPTLAEKIERCAGQSDCHVLPHQYLHLVPLVGTA
jgi:hypothetical protein